MYLEARKRVQAAAKHPGDSAFPVPVLCHLLNTFQPSEEEKVHEEHVFERTQKRLFESLCESATMGARKRRVVSKDAQDGTVVE